MKNITKILSSVLLLVALLVTTGGMKVAAQYKLAETKKLELTGTSTLHNWEMTLKDPAITVTPVFDAKGKLTDFNNLTFTANAEALKSGKGSMDKNAYKALKTNEHKSIGYQSNNITVTNKDGLNYDVKCEGNMTISGVTKPCVLNATCVVNADKSITVIGTNTIKMSEYKVEPPTFMFGAVKTGDVVVFHFNVTLK